MLNSKSEEIRKEADKIIKEHKGGEETVLNMVTVYNKALDEQREAGIKEGKIAKSDVIKIQLLDKNENELKEDQKITLDLLKKVAGEKKELTTKDIKKYLQKHQSELNLINKDFSDTIEKKETQKENYIKDNYKKMKQYGGLATLYIGIVFFSIPFGALFVEEMGVSIYSILGIAIPAVINMIILAIMSFKINVFTQKGID